MDISALLPIYILVITGFVLVKLQYVPIDVIRPANVLVVKVFVPVLIFLVIFAITQNANFSMKFIIGYGLASVIVLLLAMSVLTWIFGHTVATASLLSLGSAGSNSVFIGFPIVFLSYAHIADASLGWVLLVENLLIIPLAFFFHGFFAKSGKTNNRILWELLKHPIMIAIIAGLCIPLVVKTIWTPLAQALDMLRLATAGLSLVLIGGMLARLKFGSSSGGVFAIAAIKLLLHPAATLMIFLSLGIRGEELIVGMIYASAPCFGVYANFCEAAGEGEFGASVFFMTTLLAPLMISAWYAVLALL